MPQMQDIHVTKIAWSSCSSQPVDWPKFSCLLLQPWCMPIAGYHTSSDKVIVSNNQWAAIEKTSKSLLGTSQPIMKNENHHKQNVRMVIHLTVLCTSSGLMCSYIATIHNKRIATSCVTWNLLQSIGIIWLFSNILSADCFAIVYSANSLLRSYTNYWYSEIR